MKKKLILSEYSLLFIDGVWWCMSRSKWRMVGSENDIFLLLRLSKDKVKKSDRFFKWVLRVFKLKKKTTIKKWKNIHAIFISPSRHSVGLYFLLFVKKTGKIITLLSSSSQNKKENKNHSSIPGVSLFVMFVYIYTQFLYIFFFLRFSFWIFIWKRKTCLTFLFAHWLNLFEH